MNMKRKRIISVLLSLMMIFNCFPGTIFADADSGTEGTVISGTYSGLIESSDVNITSGGAITIVSFAVLPEEEAKRGFTAEDIPYSEAISALDLPASLDAFGEDGGTLTVEGVTWGCSPAFESAVLGEYIFTAVLPDGYAPGEAAELPEITVIVSMSIMKMDASVPGIPDTAWYEADPSATHFDINTADELAGLAQIVNTGIDSFEQDRVNLCEDIDLSAYGKNYAGGRGWEPIGTKDAPFCGNFSGTAHTITGLYINTTGDAGLFGYVEKRKGGGISNIGVAGADISTDGNAGVIVGHYVLTPESLSTNTPYIQYIYSTGIIRSANIAGGIVGVVEGLMADPVKIMWCYSTVSVTSSSTAGGIVGLVVNMIVDTQNFIGLFALNERINAPNAARLFVLKNDGSTTVSGWPDASAPNYAFERLGGIAWGPDTETLRNGTSFLEEDWENKVLPELRTAMGVVYTPGWVEADGMLPGFGTAVPMPEFPVIDYDADILKAETYLKEQNFAGSQSEIDSEEKAQTYVNNLLSNMSSANLAGCTWSLSGNEFIAAAAGTVDNLAGMDGRYSFSVTLTAADGITESDPIDLVLNITAAAYDATQDNADITAANTAVSGAAYSAAQAEAPEEAAALAKVNSILAALELNEVTADVIKVSYTAPVAGTPSNLNGTGGSYIFKVTLNKGGGMEQTTEELSLAITATSYYDTDDGAIDAANTAVSGADYRAAAQALVPDEAAALARIENVIAGLELNEVTADVIKISYTAPVAGTPSNLNGTDGSYIFKVTLNKGGGTEQTTEELSLAIIATPYYATPDDTAIGAAEAAVSDAAYTVTQAAAPDEAAALAKINSVIASLELNGVTPAVAKISYTAPVAGTPANLAGTDGSYVFSVTLNKGAGTEQTVTPLTLKITAAAYDSTQDNIDIAAAKTAVSGAAYGAAQAEVPDEAAALAKINSVIASLELNGVTPAVAKISYTAPVAGTPAKLEGTDGSYVFSVTLNKGAGTELAVTPLILKITATAYDATQDNTDIAAAKAAVSGAAYGAAQAEAPDEAAALAKINSAIASLELNGVTPAVAKISYTAPVAGTPASLAGTDGSYVFSVTLNKGAGTELAVTPLILKITATAYDATQDNTDIAAAKAAVSGAAYGAAQAESPDEVSSLAKINSVIASLELNGVTPAVAKISYIAPVAGTPAKLEGTDGSYVFSVTLNKGAGTELAVTPLILKITATAYDATQDNTDIAVAKAAVSGAAYGTAQAESPDEATSLAKVNSILAGLELNGVTAAVTKISYTAPASGWMDNLAGTDGSFVFSVSLNKGGGTEQTVSPLTLTVTATPYVPNQDDADITAVKEMLTNYIYSVSQTEAPTQAAAMNKIKEANTMLTAQLNRVRVEDMGIYFAREPIAGTLASPMGQDGRYVFSAKLRKGTGMEQSVELTIIIRATAYVDYSWYTANPDAKDFTITNADQLASFANIVNGTAGGITRDSFQGKTILLGADIDLSAYGKGSDFNGGKGWIPIGIADMPYTGRVFSGIFNGQGHKITGLYINDDALRAAGLFGAADGSMLISNTDMVGVDITNYGYRWPRSWISAGGGGTGAIAGIMSGSLENCSVSGSVKGSSHVGGLVGTQYQGRTARCYSTCEVSAQSSYGSGGIAGYCLFTDISQCYSTGNVTGALTVGGIVGDMHQGGRVSDCYSTGNITGVEDVGGIVGINYIYESHVINCYATGEVSGKKNVGGIVGFYWRGGVYLNNTYSVGNVALNRSVKGETNVGRVIGNNDGSNNVDYGYAFDGLLNGGGTTAWSNIAINKIDGKNLTAAQAKQSAFYMTAFTEVPQDAFLGYDYLMWNERVWNFADGKLPVLKSVGGNQTGTVPGHLVGSVSPPNSNSSNNSSSSGGSSGSRSSSNSVSANGSVSVSASRTNGSLSLNLSNSKITEIINNTENNNALIDASNFSEITDLKMPVTAIDRLANEELGIEVKLPQGTVALDSGALQSVAEAANTDPIAIRLDKAEPSDLTAAQRAATGSGNLVFDVIVSSGTQEIRNFGGTVSVTVPYSGTLPVAVWYLRDNGNLEKVNSSYDADTQAVTFTTNHLSKYMVGLDYDSAPELAIPQTVTPQMPVNPFEDVTADDWFIDNVIYVYDNELMSGTNASPMLFSPNTPITRAMVVAILYRHAGSSDVSNAENLFVDIAEEAYYADAVKWASQNGIVSGYDGKFTPDASITRQDLAVILTNYMEFLEVNPVLTQQYVLFADEADISDYAKNALQTLHKLGIISGIGGNVIDPKGYATRAQAATMLHRFVEDVLN